MLMHAYKNRFRDIFPWPNFCQAYCTLVMSNMVFESTYCSNRTTAIVALCSSNLATGVIRGAFSHASWAHGLRCRRCLGHGRCWGLRVPLDRESALVAALRDRITFVAIGATVEVVRAAYRLLS